MGLDNKNKSSSPRLLRAKTVFKFEGQPGDLKQCILNASINAMVRREKESYPYEPIASFLRADLEEPSHPFLTVSGTDITS